MNHWTAYDRWEQRMTLSPETRKAVRDGCKRSAAACLPMIFATLGTPRALLDVGAGEGWWLEASRALGVKANVGLDWDADRERNVYHWDAEAAYELPLYQPGRGERWPLALCLETAEHVSPAAGDHLVSELCRVADEIVWSAAIPGQGGDGHINEQWPEYWAERFNQHGYVLDDPWRLDLWSNPDVEPWYAQNLLLAYRHGVTLQVVGDGQGERPMRQSPPLALVHPVTWSHHRGVPAPDRS